MAGQRVATLEILIDATTGRSLQNVAALGGAVDNTTSGILRSWQRVDQYTNGMGDMSVPIRGINQYGQEVATTAAQVTRDKNRIESAGERLVSQLEREANTYGKTSVELRNMRVAFAAAAAEAQGMTELATRLRAAGLEMERLEASADGLTRSAGRSTFALRETALQIPDIVQGLLTGQHPMQVFIQQGGQIAQIGMMAEGGLKGFAGQLGGVALMALPAAAAAGVAFVAFKRWHDELNDGSGLAAYAQQLGLTQKQIDKLGGDTVTMGDMVKGVWKTVVDDLKAEFGGGSKRLVDYLFSPTDARQVETLLAQIYGVFVGEYHAVIETWRQFPSAFADLIIQGVNKGAAGLEWLVNKAIDGANALGLHLNHVNLGGLANGFAGAAHEVGAVFDREIGKATSRAQSSIDHFIATAGKNAIGAARDRLADGATDKVGKVSDDLARQAEQLERQLASIWEKLQGQFDPLAEAATKYSEALADIFALEKGGWLQPDQAGDWAMKAALAFTAAKRKIEAETKAPIDLGADIHIDTLSIVGEIDQGYVALQKQLELWGKIDDQVQVLAGHMRDAFGQRGGAIGDALVVLGRYGDEQAKIAEERRQDGVTQKQLDALTQRSADNQLNSAIGLTGALKGMFAEHSAGYKAMEAAEKALTIVQLARTAVAVAEGAAQMFASMGPAGFPAVAAMLGVMAAVGFSGGGGGSSSLPASNTGTGTVLGDPTKGSESIKNAISLLHDVADATLTVSRDMAASLRAIETSIGGLASLLVRTGNVNADDQVSAGFKTSTIGSVLSNIPLIGGLLSSLFGTKTSVIGSGLYGDSQTVGDILSSGYNLNTYSDVEKKKKLFGITTSTKYSTVYGDADSSIEDQFTLVLRSFYTAIGKAAPELGQATSDVENRLNSFVFSLGKIDIAGKTGTEIQELLENALGAAADQMAATAFPGFERFQKVGEGLFETITRVATTVEQVDATFRKLGVTATSLGIDVDMAVAGMFDNVSDFTSLADAYFSDFYTKQEQAAANTAQLTRALGSLGIAVPDTLAAYRQLVEAQDLTTDAGRSTYVTLLQLAPAFSDLKTSLEGAKSAADILSEREDLNTKLLQLTGDTAALRAAELAKLDPSNRALQEQIYAIQDAQDAAKAASDLASAWSSVGDSIMDEVRRIRGLTDASSGGSFASLLGQFNVATSSARAGDQDAAKLLPGLSQSLLTAAQAAATSRQELDRIQAQTAASLEATYGVISALTGTASHTSPLDSAATAAQASTSTSAANDDTAAAIADLKSELADMSAKLTSALATIAGNTGQTAKKLSDFSETSGGDAVRVVAA